MSNKQALLVAKMRQIELSKKKRPLQDSGAVPSQWGGMTSDSRLLSMGHYEKSSDKAKLDYVREQIRRTKAENETAKPKLIITVHR